MNNIQRTVILPELIFMSQDEESKLPPYEQGVRHGKETMLDAVKTALLKAGIRYQGLSELKTYDNIPEHFTYYRSVSKDAWVVRVTNIYRVNRETHTPLNEPEIIFVYEASGQKGEMPLSEFNRAYRPLLTSTTAHGKRSRTDRNWIEAEKENNDYSRYL
ncbi:hypothetical protein FPE09_000414 [Salmonella enterica subsp. enterica serovar Braenderup]|nr:hypothetical protein [Salmonella enterica subsp. enterica serovar Braenderup]EBW6852512.1 hypothetical protein [Salmonella enterica subsp. enterica serovar Braenderup]ECD4823253.1 hypothetical protein [Salmonella enterica subsp. enterica serovar Braenderup]ECG5345473.1 hypothetical protein [Salmonella enterica subsp. enterica serovar Braenderup]EDQ6473746.1 hypothetical protein [Salmonella enterica subsp. enterica serovar Braenderup]